MTCPGFFLVSDVPSVEAQGAHKPFHRFLLALGAWVSNGKGQNDGPFPGCRASGWENCLRAIRMVCFRRLSLIMLIPSWMEVLKLGPA